MTTKKYRPASGTEGVEFMDRFCCLCAKDAAYRDGRGDSCPIAAAAVSFRINEPEYPVEWTFDATGQPCCTAFEPLEAERPDPNAHLQTELDMPPSET